MSFRLVLDALSFARSLLRSRSSLAAENFFLRKQLTFYVERERRPRTKNATRFTMATLTRLFDWTNALVVVTPDTLIEEVLQNHATRMESESEGSFDVALAPKRCDRDPARSPRD